MPGVSWADRQVEGVPYSRIAGQSVPSLTLLNRYRIDALLGQGGLGIVCRGYDLLLNRSVALKVLNATNLSPAGKARLLTEAQAAAKLNHINIITTLDVAEIDGVPFTVMDLVHGETLNSPIPT